MTIIDSKTRAGSKTTSRLADSTEVKQTNFQNKFGGVSPDQLVQGVGFSNLQSTLDDVVNCYQTRVGGIIMLDNAQSLDPNGVSMTERLTITGLSNDTYIEVYGIPVAIDRYDNETATTNKIIAVLNKYVSNGIAFKAVQLVNGTTNQIDVTFIDTNPHENYFSELNGIMISGSTTTPALPGYGSWSIIGQSTVTMSGLGTTTIDYWRRNS